MEDRVAAATICHHGQAPELSSISEFPPPSSPALSLSLCVRDSIFRHFSSHPYIHRYTAQLIHSCLYCFVCLTTITMCPIAVCLERRGMGHIDSALCKPELCLGLTSGCPGAVEWHCYQAWSPLCLEPSALFQPKMLSIGHLWCLCSEGRGPKAGQSTWVEGWEQENEFTHSLPAPKTPRVMASKQSWVLPTLHHPKPLDAMGSLSATPLPPRGTLKVDWLLERQRNIKWCD